MSLRYLSLVTVLGCAGQLLGCAGERALSSAAHEDATIRRVARDRLRAEEEQQCAGLSRAERQTSVLDPRDIVGVRPLFEQTARLKQTWNALRGSLIELRSERAETKQWLARRARCEIASLAAEDSAAAYNPLALGPVQVEVAELATGFAVAIRTAHDDPALAKRVLRASEALRSERTASR